MMRCLTRDAPEQFAACWARTVSAFPGTADGLKQEAYYQELADLPIASVEHAAAIIRRMESFLPSAGHWFRIADNHAAEQLVTAAPERWQLRCGPLVDCPHARTLRGFQWQGQPGLESCAGQATTRPAI